MYLSMDLCISQSISWSACGQSHLLSGNPRFPWFGCKLRNSQNSQRRELNFDRNLVVPEYYLCFCFCFFSMT